MPPVLRAVQLFGFAASISVLCATTASAADWIVDVTGTWKITVNNRGGTLVVASEEATGQCRGITGTVLGSPMEGFYCVNSGRFVFVRKALSGATLDVYTGNFGKSSVDFSGQVSVIIGSLAVSTTPGEYDFWGHP